MRTLHQCLLLDKAEKAGLCSTPQQKEPDPTKVASGFFDSKCLLNNNHASIMLFLKQLMAFNKSISIKR